MEQLAIDTNIGVLILNNKIDIVSLLNDFSVICLPVTVCGELLFGAKNSAKKIENEAKVKWLIESCTILNINNFVAEEYAKIRKQLNDKGKPIPENDIWIAAICMFNGIPLATKDKHFGYIDGLTILDIE